MFHTAVRRGHHPSLDIILGAHIAAASAGFVAVDFYDGSIIYDFERFKDPLFVAAYPTLGCAAS